MGTPSSLRSAARRERDYNAVKNSNWKALTETGLGEMLAKFYSYALLEVKSSQPDKGYEETFGHLLTEAIRRLDTEKMLKSHSDSEQCKL